MGIKSFFETAPLSDFSDALHQKKLDHGCAGNVWATMPSKPDGAASAY
jgi:hypothetical protein